MTKTVKKLIEDAKEAIGDDFDYLLDEILEKHEEELAEKDEEIFKLHNECKSLFCQIGTEQIKNDKLKQQQLFKEDFDEYCQYVNGRREDTYIIKDKSLYKKLPSKDVK